MSTESDRRQRVLLIEDDDGDAVLVSRSLERFQGFELRHVADMQAALKVLAAEKFDIALLDLSLPDSFGLEGVSALKSQYADLPVVVLTGLEDSELALKALEFGAQDYLSKNECSAELLVRTLRYAIQRQEIQAEKQRLLSELSRQARHDALTGILNRRSLMVELERERERSVRTRNPLACVLLDVDYFKRVNDVHGHGAGDTVLQAMAAVLKRGCRLCDVVGRYGGEEFLAILPHTPEAGAAVWAERVRRMIAATPIFIGGASLQVTASFGVSVFTADDSTCVEVVDRADQALRAAKQLGRDRVVTFEETLAAAGGASPAAEDEDASRFLLGLRLDSAPVVDEEGALVGMIGEEDLAQSLLADRDWNQPVSEIMRKRPVSFAPNSLAASIHEFLSRNGSRRVAILDGRRPIGIVSRASMLRWREYHALASRSLLTESPDDGQPNTTRASLLGIIGEVGRQAELLEVCLCGGSDPPLQTTVASATRIQLLLEDAVLAAQRLEGGCRDGSTIGVMVG